MKNIIKTAIIVIIFMIGVIIVLGEKEENDFSRQINDSQNTKQSFSVPKMRIGAPNNKLQNDTPRYFDGNDY